MEYEALMHEVETSTWQPEFEFTNSIFYAVDSMLVPHEDYKLNLHAKVMEIIAREIEASSDVDVYEISLRDICNWQKELFDSKKEKFDAKVAEQGDFKMPNMYVRLGLRTSNGIKVNNHTPPNCWVLEDLLQQIFPVCKDSIYSGLSKGAYEEIMLKQLTEWFKIFETIHPFEDLNGRIGSIVINILSFLSTGKYLVNKEYNKHKT